MYDIFFFSFSSLFFFCFVAHANHSPGVARVTWFLTAECNGYSRQKLQSDPPLNEAQGHTQAESMLVVPGATDVVSVMVYGFRILHTSVPGETR